MLVFEQSPWPRLTLIVSLEAELHVNTEMTRVIESLVREIHQTVREPGTGALDTASVPSS